MIAGTPDSVAEQILAFREQTGDFGELVYAGLDWVDPDLARRSMELMASRSCPDQCLLSWRGPTGCRCRRRRRRASSALAAEAPGRAAR